MADHLHQNQMIRILEQYQVSAAPGSVPSTSLPLTFFDIPWIMCHPIQRIFFYHFPHPTHHFLHTLLPTLKHSLSLTLQHFFPFAANLVFPPNPHLNHPYILYHESDSIPFTIAESTADFNHLVSHSPKNVSDLHPFVPALPPPRTSQNGTRFVPLFAIQLTILPNSGFCICATYAHVAGDGAAFLHFMKFWGSVCKARGDLSSLEASLPCHNREIIDDPKGIKLINLELLKNWEPEPKEFASLVHVDNVRATFVLSRDQIEKLKKWVMAKGSGDLHISSFVVTSSLVWVYCRNYPDVSVPKTYFGNCLLNRFVRLKRGQLVGENGFMEAVNGIEIKVRDVKSDVLKGAEAFMSNFLKVATSGEPMVIIAGSPKLGSYECDFGLGKPRKCELVHINSSTSVSLSDCWEEGGIEIGVALAKTQMNCFAAILEEQLATMIACD
ncbi:coumaroyl-CoA:anthocyanidin 3-O-glucoside-6''-O-coumaroyltransferase 1-like [Senna tora]|uniref:Coumaroyl-CoA:anthocyanidin 3-O-glucoside-6''-O-coumaroyltransferase 1-like n=1 Tax=Senna tora TaxID=362788 RepID=A0A834TIY9_9FABA|nr:coumaroyl-CoA:anthocyanidin 3-O-glucoside-6''-O-coumaroyltransferase 1-like [Senna tora]